MCKETATLSGRILFSFKDFSKKICHWESQLRAPVPSLWPRISNLLQFLSLPGGLSRMTGQRETRSWDTQYKNKCMEASQDKLQIGLIQSEAVSVLLAQNKSTTSWRVVFFFKFTFQKKRSGKKCSLLLFLVFYCRTGVRFSECLQTWATAWK